MLIYYSLQPGLCDSDDPGDKIKAEKCGRLLNLITNNHIRTTAPLLATLEKEHIILGNGGFMAVSIFFKDEILFDESSSAHLKSLIDASEKHIDAPIFFCYTSLGHIYYLICYPRLEGESESEHGFIDSMTLSFKNIYKDVKDIYPGIRFILSDMLTGEKSIFITTNSLNHAKEYCLFKSSTPAVMHISMQDMLHAGLITDTEFYKPLSTFVAGSLISDSCDCEKLGRETVSKILENAAPAMESIHHHTQIFMLSFTEYLSSNGIINSSYLDRKDILYRIMRFETEKDFIGNLSTLLTELRKQYLMLESVGKKNQISRVRSYIDENITDASLSLQAVSEHFNITPTQLTRQFKSYFGVTLYNYLQQKRHKTAQKKLHDNPKITMQQLAASCGYNDISTMYRAFKKYEGITPGHYKNL